MAAKKATKNKRHVITLRVSPGIHKLLRVAAAQEGTTMQAIILRGVDLWALGVAK